MEEVKSGIVYLVGAGPGDPELVTLRGAKVLASADVVVYDALVQERLLDMAPKDAELVYMGKRCGRTCPSQDEINDTLVEQAMTSKTVVRLKGGDPFVFGRGGEEALALRAAGVTFDVVPGVSSALAAPALAGIPVTHRSLASALVVVSGHAEAAWRPVLARLAPGSATVVVLMGLASRGAIATVEMELRLPNASGRVPSMGSTATSTSGCEPLPTASPLKSMGALSFSPSPMTTIPSISTEPKAKRIASTAAWSAVDSAAVD